MEKNRSIAMRNFKVNVRHLVMIFLLLPVVAVYAGDKKPGWITQRPVSRFYYIGIGYASKAEHPTDYHQVARDQALNDLASEIEIKISGETIQKLSEMAGVVKEDVLSQIRSTTRAHLEGYEQVAAWEDANDYWVYYHLSKEVYQKLQKERKIKAINLAKDFYLKAKDEEKKGNIASAIRYYMQALQSFQEFIGEPVSVQIGGKSRYLQNEIYFALQQLFMNIKLQPLTGKLNIKMTKGKAQPVKVKATYQPQGNPVAGLPVAFKFVKGKGKIDSPVNSDRQGIATGMISSMLSSEKLQILRAFTGPDLFVDTGSNPLLQQLIRNLNTPATKILLTVSGLQIYIESKEENLGKPVDVLYIEPRLKKILSDSGFVFVDNPADADFLIQVEAATRKGGQVYNLYSAFGDITISVLDLSSGNELYKKAINNFKGIQLDFEKAGIKALQEGGKKTEQIIPEIIKVIRE